jgi:hypothetical protein
MSDFDRLDDIRARVEHLREAIESKRPRGIYHGHEDAEIWRLEWCIAEIERLRGKLASEGER